MNFNSKQAVCDWVNQKIAEKHIPRTSLKESFQQLSFADWFIEEFLRPRKIHVPIYTSKWKLKALRKIQHALYSTEELEIHQWKPKKDLSKIIRPDGWESYPFETPIAIPKYTTEHSKCWEVILVHAFMQENIQFGIRPMFAFRYTVDIGRGPILVDKKQGKLHQLGSFLSENYIVEFENNLDD